MKSETKVTLARMDQFQVGKLGGHFFQIGNGRYPTLLQCLDQYSVFDGGPQSMTGIPLGVGNGNIATLLAKCLP